MSVIADQRSRNPQKWSVDATLRNGAHMWVHADTEAEARADMARYASYGPRTLYPPDNVGYGKTTYTPTPAKPSPATYNGVTVPSTTTGYYKVIAGSKSWYFTTGNEALAAQAARQTGGTIQGNVRPSDPARWASSFNPRGPNYP